MIKGTRISVVIAVATVFVAAAVPISTEAATCNVPSGSHPVIQTAVDDSGCAPIVVAAGSYPESVVIFRTVNLIGAGSGHTFIHIHSAWHRIHRVYGIDQYRKGV